MNAVSSRRCGASRASRAAGPGDSLAPIQAMADSLLSIRDHATLAAVFACNVRALSYYELLYRSRLVPRWVSASHPSSSARDESTARGGLLPPTARPKPASTASPTSVTMWS